MTGAGRTAALPHYRYVKILNKYIISNFKKKLNKYFLHKNVFARFTSLQGNFTTHTLVNNI